MKSHCVLSGDRGCFAPALSKFSVLPVSPRPCTMSAQSDRQLHRSHCAGLPRRAPRPSSWGSNWSTDSRVCEASFVRRLLAEEARTALCGAASVPAEQGYCGWPRDRAPLGRKPRASALRCCGSRLLNSRVPYRTCCTAMISACQSHDQRSPAPTFPEPDLNYAECRLREQAKPR